MEKQKHHFFRFGNPGGMRNYWSNRAVANWIRNKWGVAKPVAATMEEWDEYHKAAKEHNKFIEWLTDDVFNFLQDVVCYPSDVFGRFRSYFVNRFVFKEHYLRTGLQPGCYFDFDTRLLHGCFESLVDFIEIEKALLHCWTDKEERKKHARYNIPIIGRFLPFREPQAGLDYLKWEMSLAEPQIDEWGTDHSSPHQAAAAKEQFELYNWWKFVRPNRPDPHDASGWTQFYEDMRTKYGEGMGTWRKQLNSVEEAFQKSALEGCFAIEQAYEKEDEEMLMRLIKIRGHLWT